MQERWARIGFWCVLIAAGVLLQIGAGSVPLLDPDESRFARTSVEMLRSGDLVVPTFEGQPRLVKPPLLHWLQSALFRVLGKGERIARLPAACATWAALLLVGWIARRRFGHEGALWAAAVLGTMPLVFAVGRVGTLDALLALHVLAAVALDIAEPKETRDHRAPAIGALLGLAFLVKGPVGVVLPLLIMLAGRTASGREILPTPTALLQGLAAWSVVVLPWGLAFVDRVGLDAVVDVVRDEALGRYFSGVDHIEPPWFFLLVVVVGLLPWVGPLGLGLLRVLTQRDDPAARTALYAGAGFLVGLLFFSLGRSKLANYLLPLAPLAALVVTWELGQELNAPRERITGPLLLSATTGVLAVGLALVSSMDLDATVRLMAAAGAIAYGLASVGAWVGVLARRPRWVWGSAAVGAALFLLAAATILLPAVSLTRTSAHLIERVPELGSTERSLVVVDMKVPSLTFYLDRVPEEVDLVDLERRISVADDPLFVFDEVDWPRATQSAKSRLREVARQGKYIVFEKTRGLGPGEIPPKPTQ